jgi:Short C-terminal domain
MTRCTGKLLIGIELNTGHMTVIADDIREFAELLVKLGDLRDSGLLTDDEFNEQKERLLTR